MTDENGTLQQGELAIIPPAPPEAPVADDIMLKPAAVFFTELLTQMLGNNAKDATMYLKVNNPLGGGAIMVGFTINIAGVKEVAAPEQPLTVKKAVTEVLAGSHSLTPATGKEGLFDGIPQ